MIPGVSVIVPARDEERDLDRCLAAIARQQWPGGELEVVVVENGSRDRTRAIAEGWAARDPRVRVVVSAARNQAEAMNAGLAAARAPIVARVDAHGHVADDYLAQVAAAFARHPDAAGVGGRFLPAGETVRERAAGLARSSRLGVGGGYGSDRAAGDHRVDTVQCGAYRRAALADVGGFDPAMAYGEDEELNWRLVRSGRPLWLCPALRQHYRPRGTLAALGRQYWHYGRGRLRVLRKHPDFLRLRHLAPSALVAGLAGLGAAAVAWTPAARAVAGLGGAWAAVLVAAGVQARGGGWRERLLVPLATACLHLGYGAGMLREAANGLARRRAVPVPPAGRGAAAPLRLSVVVCTKDRPASLARCLASLARQAAPPAELIVVDAGGAPAAEPVRAFAAAVPRCRTRHLRTAPGLPRQRNRGAREAGGDVVVYLDDDVVLEPGYLGAIARVYAADPGGAIGGVGGAQVPDPTPREGALRRAACRLFLLDGYGRGVVKRSGRVEYVFAPPRPLDVEFLSGCNMSFRREVLAALAFDERLAGYALGEDLQFSYRVSRRWRLVLTPEARCEHRHADGGRPRGDAFRAMAVFNKYLFVRECVARRRLDWLAFGWAAAGDALLRLRAPRARGLPGLVRGWTLVWRHARHGALPET